MTEDFDPEIEDQRAGEEMSRHIHDPEQLQRYLSSWKPRQLPATRINRVYAKAAAEIVRTDITKVGAMVQALFQVKPAANISVLCELSKAGKSEEARRLFYELREKHGKAWLEKSSHTRYIAILMAIGETSDAERELCNIEDSNIFPFAENVAVFLVEELERADLAEQIWQIALEKNPSSNWHIKHFEFLKQYLPEGLQTQLQSLITRYTLRQKAEPKNFDMHIDFIELMIATRNYHQATSACYCMMASDRSEPVLNRCITIADRLASLGHVGHAKRIWQEVTRCNERLRPAYYAFLRRVKKGTKRKDNEEGTESRAEDAIDANPARTAVVGKLCFKAHEIAREGRLSEAVLLWREYLRSHPDDVRMHSAYTRFVARYSNTSEYLASLEEILTLNPSEPVVCVVMNAARDCEGKSGDGWKEVSEIWKTLMNYGGEKTCGGFANFLERRYRDMQQGLLVTYTREMLSHAPVCLNSFVALATRIHQVDPRVSKLVFSEIRSFNPRECDKTFRKAMDLQRAGNIEEAVQCWLPLEAASADLCGRFALSLERKGLSVQAERLWEAIAAVNPKFCMFFGCQFFMAQVRPEVAYACIHTLLPSEASMPVDETQKRALLVLAALAGRKPQVYQNILEASLADLQQAQGLSQADVSTFTAVRDSYKRQLRDEEVETYTHADLPTLHRPAIFDNLQGKMPKKPYYENRQARNVFKESDNDFEGGKPRRKRHP